MGVGVWKRWASARRHAGKLVSVFSGPMEYLWAAGGQAGREATPHPNSLIPPPSPAGWMRHALRFPAVPGGGGRGGGSWRVRKAAQIPPVSGPVRRRLGGNRSLEAESPQLFSFHSRAGRDGRDGGGKEPGELVVLPG